MDDPINVLHADDEGAFGEMAATFLEREDDRMAVETVRSADEGLDRLAEGEYECVVSDYEMPGTDGIEFLRRIREEWPDLPFILFTGKGSEEIASDAISAGVTDYLQKKSDSGQYKLLANRIDNAVSQFRAERRVEEERERFRKLFDRFSQPTVDVEFQDGEPVAERVNPAFEETFGYDADAVVGDLLDDYIVPEDKLEEAERINDHISGGERVEAEEVTRKTADGRRKFLLQNAIYDDGGGGFGIYTDITERREREEKLERSQELLRHTEQLAGVGGWEADVETGELSWTRGTYAIHDLDPNGEFEPTVESGLDFYHPDDRETIETAVERCREHGDPYERDLRVITASGEQKWVRTIGNPVYDGDEVTKIRGAIQDITEQRRRRGELQRYEKLVEYSPELLVVLDEEMTVEYQSPPSPLLEWEPLDVAGENALENIHPDDHDEVTEQVVRLQRHPDRIATAEFRVRGADGGWRWVESRAQNFTDNAVGGILAAVREITRRKRQEQELARYSTVLEQLQSTTKTLLETRDVEQAARRAIEGFETILEFDIACVWLSTDDQRALEPVAISERGREIVPEPPTYTAETESISWEVYQEQELRYIGDVRADDRRLNEDTPIGSEVIVPLGRHGLLNVGATDPDAFSERDVNLIELWSDTLAVVLARITQLELLRERETELTRERDRLDEFTSVVSHDLRSPLSVAKGRAELAAGDCDNEHLAHVQRALTRMEKLLDDSLALARQGKVVGETATVDLGDAASRCWQTVSTGEASLVIEESATIRADEDRLPEVFENLFRNAIEHGGESVRITVGPTDDGFYVADDGEGIPPENRSKVFESGFTTSDDGNGFGLAIAEQICEAHGWEVDVTETEAGGARFELIGVEVAG